MADAKADSASPPGAAQAGRIGWWAVRPSEGNSQSSADLSPCPAGFAGAAGPVPRVRPDRPAAGPGHLPHLRLQQGGDLRLRHGIDRVYPLQVRFAKLSGPVAVVHGREHPALRHGDRSLHLVQVASERTHRYSVAPRGIDGDLAGHECDGKIIDRDRLECRKIQPGLRVPERPIALGAPRNYRFDCGLLGLPGWPCGYGGPGARRWFPRAVAPAWPCCPARRNT